MPESTPTTASRTQRIIAYMIAAMVLLSVISFILLLGAAYLGGSGDFDRGVWPVVAVTPLIALPLAVAGWVALLIVSMRRRALENAQEQRARAAAKPSAASKQGPKAGGGSRNTAAKQKARGGSRSPSS